MIEAQLSELVTLVIFLVKIVILAFAWYFNAKAIIGFNRACQYQKDEQGKVLTKMIFWKVKVWSDKTLGEFWSKPVYSCCTCMASVHGIIPVTATHLFLFGLNWMIIPSVIFYILSLSGQTSYLNEQ